MTERLQIIIEAVAGSQNRIEDKLTQIVSESRIQTTEIKNQTMELKNLHHVQFNDNISRDRQRREVIQVVQELAKSNRHLSIGFVIAGTLIVIICLVSVFKQEFFADVGGSKVKIGSGKI